jgi:hypothetical protein
MTRKDGTRSQESRERKYRRRPKMKRRKECKIRQRNTVANPQRGLV